MGHFLATGDIIFTPPAPVLAVWVNTLLPSMTPGKAQAHSGHAASQFAVLAMGLDTESDDRKLFDLWEDGRGFGTQTNLLLNKDSDIDDLAVFGDDRNYLWGIVEDPTYPYLVDEEVVGLIDEDVHTLPPKYSEKFGKYICFRNQITAFWLFGDNNDPIFNNQLKRFDLHP